MPTASATSCWRCAGKTLHTNAGFVARSRRPCGDEKNIPPSRREAEQPVCHHVPRLGQRRASSRRCTCTQKGPETQPLRPFAPHRGRYPRDQGKNAVVTDSAQTRPARGAQLGHEGHRSFAFRSTGPARSADFTTFARAKPPVERSPADGLVITAGVGGSLTRPGWKGGPR